MNLKAITLDQLRSDYKGRHGFVFEGSSPSDDTGVQTLCDSLIKYGCAVEQPEFVTRLDERTFVFVYPENTSFDMPTFLQVSDHLSQITNAFAVDSLHNLINTPKQ